jgi:hypothetical protein
LEWKYYLTLLGESTYTFEKSAYIVGIVDPKLSTYISLQMLKVRIRWAKCRQREGKRVIGVVGNRVNLTR